MHGEGTMYMSNGDVHYCRNWFENQPHGGVYRTKEGVQFIGEFLTNNFTGKGKLIKPDGSKYEGNFKAGAFHGKGTYVFANGFKYTGDW